MAYKTEIKTEAITEANGLYLYDKNEKIIRIVSRKAIRALEATETLSDERYLSNKLYAEINLIDDEIMKNVEYLSVPTGEFTHLFFFLKDYKTQNDTLILQGVESGIEELRKTPIYDVRPQESELRPAVEQILDGTNWTIGNVPSVGKKSTNVYYSDAFTALKKYADVWNVEFRFIVEVNNTGIGDRYIDFRKKLGKRTGSRVVYGHNALEIIREIDRADLCTALIGRGKGEQVGETDEGEATYGRKINFSDIEWKKSKGDPVDKPKGQKYVELPERTQIFGILKNGKLVPKIGYADFSEEEDKEILLERTFETLKQASRPQVLFRTTSAYLEGQAGDTVRVVRPDLNFDYETRIFEVKRDLLTNRAVNVKLGDRLIQSQAQKEKKSISSASAKVEENILPTIEATLEKITSSDGKNTNYFSEEDPRKHGEKPRVNDLWFQPNPDDEAETIMYLWTGEAWKEVNRSSDEIKDLFDKAQKDVAKIEKKATANQQAINQAIEGSGFHTLKDLIASKMTDDEATTLFYQQAKEIGLTYLDKDGNPQAMIGIVDGKVFINGIQTMLKGDEIIADGTLTVTENMFADGITFNWAKGKTFDASQIRVINLDFDSMSGGDIELSKGFRITNNGEVVMSVDRNGKLIFNVPGLLTKDDIDKIPTIKGDKGDPGRPGEKGEKGDPGEDGKDGRPGQDGKTSYLHIAYANKNKDGEITDFSTDDPEREYVGLYRSFSSYQSTDPSDYKWSKFNNNEDIDKLIEQLDSKADMDAVTEIDEKLSDLETSSATQAQVGEIEQALRSYEEALKSQQADAENAQADLQQLLGRFATIDAQLGEYTAKMKFIDTTMTFGEEGLFIGDPATKTGIQYGKNRIDIMDNGEPVAQITQQMLKINRGIFVESLTIGEYMVAMADKGFLTINWLGGKD